MKRGFTLIELLVGMGIVSVLVGMSLLGVNIVQQSTRNTQRTDILNSLNIALNAEQINRGTYPQTLTYVAGVGGGPDSITVSATSSIRLNPPLNRQNASSPIGATTGSHTNYCYSSTGSEYWVGVQLEDGSWKYITNSSTPASTTTCSDSGL